MVKQFTVELGTDGNLPAKERGGKSQGTQRVSDVMLGIAEGPFTVFAPTNDAFAALLDELGLASLADVPVETLEAVLQMHVVPGQVRSEDLSEIV